MTETDHVYFTRRAAEERAAAAGAQHPLARRSHLELANRFDILAAAARGAPAMQFRMPAMSRRRA